MAARPGLPLEPGPGGPTIPPMFTGLIQAVVPVLAFERLEGGAALLSLPCPQTEGEAWEPELGESIAVCGCCLTVARRGPGGELLFDLSPETLERTWFGQMEPGRQVNLERAMRLSDRLGGHLVSGHVDGLGEVVAREEVGSGNWVFRFRAQEESFGRYLIEKGSVGIDGISLTVVRPEGTTWSVAVIPETMVRTNLGTAQVGQKIHLEADQIGKWVESILRTS